MYDAHLSRVYAFFAYRLGDAGDAEDLTATTFERAVRHSARYDAKRASVSTWLMAIAQNVLIDHFRHHARRPERLTDGADLDELPQAEARDRGPSLGLEPELEAALARLPERDRLIVALRFGADLRAKEVAAVTGLTEANVHQVLSRSLRRLRDALPAAGRP